MRAVSDPSPFGDGEFGFQMFQDLARMLGQPGAGQTWDAARQIAVSAATGGASEPNPDPSERIRLEQLSRVAELQVSKATGLDPVGLALVPVTRATWVSSTLDAWRPRFTQLGDRLMPASDDAEEPSMTGDMADLMGALTKMIGPTMLSMSAGSMVGQMAKHSFGTYDLPLPRRALTELALVQTNVDAFRESWSLDPDAFALWLCVHEMTHHAVLSIGHVARRVDDVLTRYLSAFEPATNGLEERLGSLGAGLDPSDLSGLNEMFADPDVLLGAIRTPAQTQLLPEIGATCSVIVGYVDRIVDDLSGTLIPGGDQISEAVRRRRVEVTPADRFVERLFGLELDQDAWDRGRAFIDGVAELGGAAALGEIWTGPDRLPTPVELDTPGVWLARVGLTAELSEDAAAALADLEVPDDLSDL